MAHEPLGFINTSQEWYFQQFYIYNVAYMQANSKYFTKVKAYVPPVLLAQKNTKFILKKAKFCTQFFLGYMHMFFFCQFWVFANLGLDHISCKHPANEGFQKFLDYLSHARDFMFYNQISHCILTISTIILEILFGLSLIYMPTN
jgi:hypothetical protein